MERQRLDDWQARLSAEMLWQLGRPFAWGVHDCMRGFADRVVLAVTGQLIELPEIGGYRTPLGAARALAKAGYADLPDLLSAHLPPIHPSSAMSGDIGLVASEGLIGYAACVFDVSAVAVLTEDGYGWRPREDAVAAYRVGMLP